MKYFFSPAKEFFTCPALAIFTLLMLLFVPIGNSPAAEKATNPDAETLTPEKLASLDVKKALFTYDSINLPDPFHPFIDFSQIERSIPTDTSQPLTPLEMYALNQFNLVGIILAGDKQNYALVEDPEQIGYTVRVGDKIGNLSGQVKEIKSNEVIIEEPYLDIFDKQQMRTISLRIRETEEELYLLD
ncbi:MAG: pilus assembly protein PilP [Pseudomonadota bacterium]|nr:pilus assembly protein PilP [Pseudomonadota bacterium]